MPPLKRGKWVHQRQAECFSLVESFSLPFFATQPLFLPLLPD